MTTTPAYVFAAAPTDPDAERAKSVMMRALAAMYDPYSIARLGDVGIPVDARCLVLGVGASRIAAHFADEAPDGEVVATDIDHAYTVRDPRVRLLTHDLVADPLPEGQWDVIHARLLLGHLRKREAILATLAGALNDNGILVVEEFAGTWGLSVLNACDFDEADRLYSAYGKAFRAVLAAQGVDLSWSRRVHKRMHALGLNVDTQGLTDTWAGCSPGTLLPWASTVLLRGKLVKHGMPAEDVDAFRALLTNPDLRVLGNLPLSTIGRRTAT